MDPSARRSRAERALTGDARGPEAIRPERDAALARAREKARLVILVEGISDLMALAAVAGPIWTSSSSCNRLGHSKALRSGSQACNSSRAHP